MRRYIICILFAIFVNTPVILAGETQAKSLYENSVWVQKDKKLRRKIFALNLINFLELDRAQKEFIISKSEELKQFKKGINKKAVFLQRKSQKVHADIYNEVIKGNLFIDYKLQKRYSEVRDEITALTERLNTKINESVRAVEHQLKEFQLLRVDNYVPCVHPKFKGNFIGGSNGQSDFNKFFWKVKKMDEREYKYFKEHLLKEEIARLKDSYCDIWDEENSGHILNEAMEKVRNMSDIDFEMKKEEISQGFLKKVVYANVRETREIKIYKCLLLEDIIPILKKQL